MATPTILQPSAAEFRMVDIADKRETLRRAVSSGVLKANPETIGMIRSRALPKGDALLVAEIAGIQAAKRASEWLPLCHQLALTSVRVWFEFFEDRVQVFCEASARAKTGVEMEALCGASAALLCVYDLTKGVDPCLQIQGVILEVKEGGKSGTWVHPLGTMRNAPSGSGPANNVASGPQDNSVLSGVRAAVFTLSDRCSRHEMTDESGPEVVRMLESSGARVEFVRVLPDDSGKLRSELLCLLNEKSLDLVVTTGGTGLSERDITPETLSELCREMGGREIPGIGELLRSSGAASLSYEKRDVSHAWLSRSSGFLIQGVLFVCLPGSPRAVRQGLAAITRLMQHALHVGRGGGH